MRRRFPIGAEVGAGGVHFRVWAPDCQRVEVVINGDQRLPLEEEKDGYFSLLTEEAKVGDLYQFSLNGETDFVPDPASRYQPQGPSGPSCIIDSTTFAWGDSEWRGISGIQGQVIYEIHVGTFTQEGTWQAAMTKLQELVELGVTVIEIMPIADFSGEFGWGYDGVNLFAPTRLYGSPTNLREFINRAHALGIGVILDVVYNHFGPHGDYITRFSKDYFNEDYTTDWGKAINFESTNAKHVREFFITNALYWIEEFHFDGLRLDATQNIYDHSTPHIIAEIVKQARTRIKHRKLLIIAENESQEIRLLEPFEQNGFGLDGVWNDDFHHSAIVRLTGKSEAYYTDYKGFSQEFISAIKYGYLYQGQYYKWQKKRRGTASLHVNPQKFIHFLENHDQVANFTQGFRLHKMTDIAILRLMTTLLLLSPATPLLFQGQEFASLSPFYFFADHDGLIGRCVWEGRKSFLTQFPSFNNPIMNLYYPDPGDRSTFLKSKLNWDEKKLHENQKIYLLHRDLLKLRREDPVFHRPQKIDGAILTSDLFLLRFFGPKNDDRLMLCNFAMDYELSPVPEPLIAPPAGKRWRLEFSSQHPLYGGLGTEIVREEAWKAPGHAAVVFKSLNNI